MIRLWHQCGASVDYSHGQNGLSYVALFADPQTDDPLTHCARCGRDLYGALRDGEFRCNAPGSVPRPRSFNPPPHAPARAGRSRHD